MHCFAWDFGNTLTLIKDQLNNNKFQCDSDELYTIELLSIMNGMNTFCFVASLQLMSCGKLIILYFFYNFVICSVQPLQLLYIPATTCIHWTLISKSESLSHSLPMLLSIVSLKPDEYNMYAEKMPTTNTKLVAWSLQSRSAISCNAHNHKHLLN